MTAPTTTPDTSAVPVDEVPAAAESAGVVDVVEQDLLVEDVSIDGMCGVY